MRSYFVFLCIAVNQATAYACVTNHLKAFSRNLRSSDFDVALSARGINVVDAVLQPRGKRRSARPTDESKPAAQKNAPTQSKEIESSSVNYARTPSQATLPSPVGQSLEIKTNFSHKQPAKVSPAAEQTSSSMSSDQFDLAKLRLSPNTGTDLVSSAAQSNSARGRSPSPRQSSSREAQSGIARGRSNSADSAQSAPSDHSRATSAGSTSSDSTASSPPRIAFSDVEYKDSIVLVGKRKNEIKGYKRINTRIPQKTSDADKSTLQTLKRLKHDARRARRAQNQALPGLLDDINNKSSMDLRYLSAVKKSGDNTSKVLHTGRTYGMSEAVTAQALSDRGNLQHIPQHLSASARAESRVYLQKQYQEALTYKSRAKFYKEKLIRYREPGAPYSAKQQQDALNRAVEVGKNYSKFLVDKYETLVGIILYFLDVFNEQSDFESRGKRRIVQRNLPVVSEESPGHIRK